MSTQAAPRHRLARALPLATLLSLACILPVATAPMPPGAAWIDQPLSGSTLPVGPVTVTVHATDPAGVAQIHLWVGDEVQASVELPDGAGILVSHEFTWDPQEEGAYLLTVRGVGDAGDWSSPATAIVTIDADAPPPSRSASPRPSGEPAPSASPGSTAGGSSTTAPSPTPRVTPRPATPTPRPATPTPRPTPAPCAPAAPTLLQPFDGEQIRDPAENPPTFTWTYRDPPSCTPTGFRIQVFADPDVGELVLDQTLGVTYSWTPTSPLEDCITYYWRVAAQGTSRGLGPWSGSSIFSLFVGRCG